MKKLFFILLCVSSLFPLHSSEPVIRGSVEGKLIRLARPEGEATHRIITIIDGQEYVLSYAGSRTRKLSLWENRTIRAEGEQVWLPGLKLPCLRIEKIVPASGNY